MEEGVEKLLDVKAIYDYKEVMLFKNSGKIQSNWDKMSKTYASQIPQNYNIVRELDMKSHLLLKRCWHLKISSRKRFSFH